MGNIVGNSDEEENDLEFDETTKDIPIPSDPTASQDTDGDIIENMEGLLSTNIDDTTSDIVEIKKSIEKKRQETGKPVVYKDVAFPTEASALYYSSETPKNWDKIEWKRPQEISYSPKMLSNGISSEDIVQGMLGNCWWLASCAAISRSPTFMKKIVPADQNLRGSDYAGVFHFRFWRFGTWVDVIVDDSLPTINGNLCFGRSADRNEFWLPLLEKAYSKLHHSYQAIEGGFTQDGMEDLTGGIAIKTALGDEAPSHFFRTLYKALRHNSFVCAGVAGNEGNTRDQKTGLINAHAYSILQATTVEYEGGKVNLVKVRNPWGNYAEWKGDWSDGSKKWDTLNSEIKQKLGYADKDDGQWWMAYDDLVRYFSDVTICSIGPDFDEDGTPVGDRWFLSMIHGSWVFESAGGSRNNVISYITNPQYYLELKEPDDFDETEDDPSERGKCSVLIGLMQEYRREKREEGVKNLYLGLNLFKIDKKPSKKLDAQFFKRHKEVASNGTYVNVREVTITAELDPGHYVIVPSTFYAGKEGSFLIRIYTEKKIDVEEL